MTGKARSAGSARHGAKRRGRLLNAAEQQAVLDLLAKGWGRVLACRKISVSHQTLLRTLDECDAFRRQVMTTEQGLDENVQMALYKSALEGSVTAQTLWLKNRRDGAADSPSAPSELAPGDATLENLTDEQLIERAQAVGIELPPKIARRLARLRAYSAEST